MKATFLGLILLIVARTTSSQIPHSVPPGTNGSPMFHSGNDLLRQCQGTEYEKNYCLAYIIGVVDLVGALEGTVDKNGRGTGSMRLCVCRLRPRADKLETWS